MILGNIRQTNIKNTALELIKRFPDQFVADDFQHNKMKVEELAEITGKLTRNKIAGYITRYLVSQKKGRMRRPISE
jgi:small subunit ribosomal protein S17e